MAPLPERDRLVTTSAPMMEDHSADVVQGWRLSDLRLLRTLRVPPARLPNGEELVWVSPQGERFVTGHRLPFVPRVMADGAVLLNAYGCGFYHVTRVGTPEPAAANVFTLDLPAGTPFGSCGIPVLVGRYGLMPVGGAPMVVALDVSDPARPFEVARLHADSSFFPHWLAKDPGPNRLILGQEMGREDGMLMRRVDEGTGRLSWEESFRSEDGSLGLSFRREAWPHGVRGNATGHAALFRE